MSNEAIVPKPSDIQEAAPQNVAEPNLSPIKSPQSQPQNPEETSPFPKGLKAYLYAWQSLLTKFNPDAKNQETMKFLDENELLEITSTLRYKKKENGVISTSEVTLDASNLQLKRKKLTSTNLRYRESEDKEHKNKAEGNVPGAHGAHLLPSKYGISANCLLNGTAAKTSLFYNESDFKKNEYSDEVTKAVQNEDLIVTGESVVEYEDIMDNIEDVAAKNKFNNNCNEVKSILQSLKKKDPKLARVKSVEVEYHSKPKDNPSAQETPLYGFTLARDVNFGLSNDSLNGHGEIATNNENDNSFNSVDSQSLSSESSTLNASQNLSFESSSLNNSQNVENREIDAVNRAENCKPLSKHRDKVTVRELIVKVLSENRNGVFTASDVLKILNEKIKIKNRESPDSIKKIRTYPPGSNNQIQSLLVELSGFGEIPPILHGVDNGTKYFWYNESYDAVLSSKSAPE